MKGKIHKVTRRYNSFICGADTPAAIPIKFGRAKTYDSIFVYNQAYDSLNVFKFSP